MDVSKRDGFAVTVGWPETYCKQPGAWFDTLGKWLKVNINGYYKIGHSAVLLIDVANAKCHYYDFGRYHTPFKTGRVRSDSTDPLLAVKTRPTFNEDKSKILNIREILLELQQNRNYHTEGKIIASYASVRFSDSLAKAKTLQQREIIDYGLLNPSKMNCGRFVSQVIRAGKPHWLRKFRLKYCTLLVPSTKSNFLALGNKTEVEHLRQERRFYPDQLMSDEEANSVLPEPNKPKQISANAQWLGGEGLGCWFDINHNGDCYLIHRWTDIGVLESAQNYKLEHGLLELDKPFQMSYPSNSEIITVVQNKHAIRLVRT